MDNSTRKLLAEALEMHEACARESTAAAGRDEVIRQLVEMERAAWSESALEIENRPMHYRYLLSKLEDLASVEERHRACEHDYLKAIAAQRYAELLGTVTDMDTLMELAVSAAPELRPFVLLQFQAQLPAALARLSADAPPRWLVHLLRQPHEVSNFLSQENCRALMEKVRELLAAGAG